MLEGNCKTFIEELSSKSPVPGGGGASAYVAAMGMALGCMVGNLTTGKKKYQHVEMDIIYLLEKSNEIIGNFERLVVKDAEVFYPLSQAYGLPKNTDDEKQVRDAVLQTALIDATLVPLEIAKFCLEAIELHEEYAKKGTRIAISDVGVGVSFCKAALIGAKFNVLINTNIMKDLELKQKIELQLKAIETKGIQKADELLKYVEDILIS